MTRKTILYEKGLEARDVIGGAIGGGLMVSPVAIPIGALACIIVGAAAPTNKETACIIAGALTAGSIMGFGGYTIAELEYEDKREARKKDVDEFEEHMRKK